MNVEVRNITRLYGSQMALDSVSFDIGKGELVGFLGPNGAGKTTMMKIIAGVLNPTRGDVRVNGSLVSAENTEVKRSIGYLPENNPLYADLYVMESLEITAGIYRLRNRKRRIAEMIEITGLGNEKHKKIGALSKGYRQRVGLAQALVHDPPVLILDEPATGLDPNQLEEIRNLIREISKEKTVMLSTHIMQEVEAVCGRVIIINNGKIVADGSTDELLSRKLSDNQILIVEFDEEPRQSQLASIDGVVNANPENGKWIVEAESGLDIRPALFRFAVGHKLTILGMQEKSQSLENVFRKLTRENGS